MATAAKNDNPYESSATGDETSRARVRWGKWAAVAALVLAPFLVITGIVLNTVVMRDVEVSPALEPLQPLGANISLSPVGFYRRCAFFVMFEPSSHLTDANAEELLSLNKMPLEYPLYLYISRKEVTDESLPTLLKLRKVSRLVVQGSGISDAGIAQLQAHFGDAAWSR